MSYQSVIPPSPTRSKPSSNSRVAQIQGFVNFVLSNLSLTTVLLVGATLQAIFVLLLPSKYALAPAFILILFRIVDTVLVTTGRKANPYLSGALMKKTSAQIPSKDGSFAGPGKEKIAVLLLGVKSNHPLGAFAPDFDVVGNYLETMNKELESGTDKESGFLGQSGYSRPSANGAEELMLISYWRTLEDVHKFAHGPTHRAAWKWWDTTFKQHDHIGIMHEVFEAERGMWEAMYVNFQPTALGATSYLRRKDGTLEGGKVAMEWISPLVDANRGPLRTSNGRRGIGGVPANQDPNGVNPYDI